VATYYHPGHLYDIVVQDLDGDGVPELLLGGVNNPGDGLGHPVLVLLELAGLGESVDGTAAPDFFGLPGLPTTTYLVLPRLDVLDAEDRKSSVVELGLDPAGRVQVRVGFPPITHIYSFSWDDLARPVLEDVTISDEFHAVHAVMKYGGTLDHDVEAAEIESYRRIGLFREAPDGNDPGLELSSVENSL